MPCQPNVLFCNGAIHDYGLLLDDELMLDELDELTLDELDELIPNELDELTLDELTLDELELDSLSSCRPST